MKAILVIDVDDKYLGKEISLIKFTDDNAIYCSAELKPMPQKKYAIQGMKGYLSTVKECEGRNKCIDEILGGNE